jgi:hypothetical protein
MANIQIKMERIDIVTLNQYIIEAYQGNYPKLKIIRLPKLRRVRL